MKYKRVLLKLSGEALMGKQQYGIDPTQLETYANEIEMAVRQGVQLAIVIGGGNIFRGLQGASNGMDRVQGDYMGMLATVINSMALQSALKNKGLKTALLSGVYIDRIADSMSANKAIELLENGHVVIISGGTGNPFFTTDTAAALRGVEIKAEVLLKGTRVDGVYTTDPEKDASAVKYDQITFEEAYNKQLKVMDLTAFTLCSENKLPILVFDMNKPGNLLAVLRGEAIGTIVTS
ncbi:MAG: UMP kinase [Bacteroidales bacterium]|nr:UMP kinase [Bacteroidales bacterium]